MPNPLRSSQQLPAFRGTPPCNRFFMDMEGRFASVSGEALDRTGISPDEWQTTTAFDLSAQSPELAYFYKMLLGGRHAETVCVFAGHTWRLIGDPVFLDGAQIGASGVAWVLEPESAPAREVFTAESDNRAYGVEEGDAFTVDYERQRVRLTRGFSFQMFTQYATTDPTCRHLPAAPPVAWGPRLV